MESGKSTGSILSPDLKILLLNTSEATVHVHSQLERRKREREKKQEVMELLQRDLLKSAFNFRVTETIENQSGGEDRARLEATKWETLAKKKQSQKCNPGLPRKMSDVCDCGTAMQIFPA